MSSPYEGGCQCGAVRYRITAEPSVVYVCHCTVCQSQTGSAFTMAMRVPEGDFHLTKGTLKKFVRVGNGQNLTCSFCADCGTRIHHVPDRSPDQVSVKPGTLDDTSWLRPTVHFYVRSALSWVNIPDDAMAFETMPKDRSWITGKSA